MGKLRKETEFFLAKVYQYLAAKYDIKWPHTFQRYTINDEIACWTLENFNALWGMSVDFVEKHMFWEPLAGYLQRNSDVKELEEAIEDVIAHGIRKKRWGNQEQFKFIISLAIQIFDPFYFDDVLPSNSPDTLIIIFCNILKKYSFGYVKNYKEEQRLLGILKALNLPKKNVNTADDNCKDNSDGDD